MDLPPTKSIYTMENWLSGMLSGLGNIFGSWISGAYGLKATRETNSANILMNTQTNATNRAIAEDTNDTNLQIAQENNEMQMQLADKAYQRSTASNQIAEFIKAGYSPEQAKILASGSQASYTAPTLQQATMIPGAPMQAGHVDAPDYSYLNGVGQGTGQVLGAALGSLTDPTGGQLGVMLSAELQDFITNNIDMLPTCSNVADLLNWCRSIVQEGPWRELTEEEIAKQMEIVGTTEDMIKTHVGHKAFEVCSAILNSPSLKRGYGTVVARNSMNTFFQRNIDQYTNMDTQALTKYKVIEQLNKNTLDELQITNDKIVTARNVLQQAQLDELAQVTNERDITRLRAEIEEFSLKLQYYQKDETKQLWLREQLNNLTMRTFISYAQMYLQGEIADIIDNNPELAHITALAQFLVDNNFFTATGAITDTIAKFIPNIGRFLSPSKGTQSVTRDLGNGTKVTETRTL